MRFLVFICSMEFRRLCEGKVFFSLGRGFGKLGVV